MIILPQTAKNVKKLKERMQDASPNLIVLMPDGVTVLPRLSDSTERGVLRRRSSGSRCVDVAGAQRTLHREHERRHRARGTRTRMPSTGRLTGTRGSGRGASSRVAPLSLMLLLMLMHSKVLRGWQALYKRKTS